VEETSAPLYAFGYGLSYTHFGYDNLSIELGPGQVKIACTVTNSGDKDGEEVVQLYLRDNVSSVVTPPIQLKEFKRVEIKKGESERVEFTLPVNSLSLYDGGDATGGGTRGVHGYDRSCLERHPATRHVLDTRIASSC